MTDKSSSSSFGSRASAPEVADELGAHPTTAGKWRLEFTDRIVRADGASRPEARRLPHRSRRWRSRPRSTARRPAPC